MRQQYVIFILDGEYYGVNIALVERIIEMQTIARVPYAPEFIQGVTNLYNTVLPVIDLRKRFGLGMQAMTSNTRLVVVTTQGIRVGMMVDGVAEVRTIDDADIESPPPIVMTINSYFINGIAKIQPEQEDDTETIHSDHLIILLDLPNVLSSKEKKALVSFKQKVQEERSAKEEVAGSK